MVDLYIYLTYMCVLIYIWIHVHTLTLPRRLLSQGDGRKRPRVQRADRAAELAALQEEAGAPIDDELLRMHEQVKEHSQYTPCMSIFLV